MNPSSLRNCDDYADFFDPNAYLQRNYIESSGHGSNKTVTFHLDSLNKIYREGNISGSRILDLGSGPTIHTLIPAVKWFDELYFADYSARNLETIRQWLSRDVDSHDWSGFFQYFAGKDHCKDTWQQYEDLLRAKIKGILFCDFHQSNPLHPEPLSQFDAVTTSFALISGSRDINQYRKALKNVASLIKTGGHIIYATVLNSPFYTVGKEKFTTVPVTKDEVKSALEDAGIEVLQWFEDNSMMNSDSDHFHGVAVVLGRKIRS